MGKKKKVRNVKYDVLLGAEVLGIVKGDICTEIQLSLANGKKQSIGVYGEGSYSDWWETFVNYRPKSKIAYYHETISNGELPKVTIRFYNEDNKVVLEIIGIFHNDSDWDYGCYLHISAEDLGIREYYYI
jgi:hypothetical protein